MYAIVKHGYVLTLVDEEPEQVDQGCSVVETSALRPGMAIPGSFLSVRRQRLAQLDAWQRSKECQGFDTGLGFALAIRDNDQRVFTGYKVLLDEALASGVYTRDTVITVGDVGGQLRQVTVGQFLPVLLLYGSFCEGLIVAKMRVEREIAAARSVAELEAILTPD